VPGEAVSAKTAKAPAVQLSYDDVVAEMLEAGKKAASVALQNHGVNGVLTAITGVALDAAISAILKSLDTTKVTILMSNGGTASAKVEWK
jgi:hypothetical protein